MSLAVFVAVLCAALLHAGWNAAIKGRANKQSAMLAMTVWQGALGAVVLLLRPWPEGDVWVWIVASGLVHTAYQLFLAYAYEQGDLSRVYPLARGTAPMLVLVAGVLVLDDRITGAEVAGIVVLGAGILLMARGVFTGGESRALLPYALGAAVATASYTLVDGMGARLSGDPLTYTGGLMAVSALFYLPVILALRGAVTARIDRQGWLTGLGAGIASAGAYAIAVWAMTLAPIALVAALRETSILFAVVIGWLVFGERMDRRKGIAAGLIVAGVALTRV